MPYSRTTCLAISLCRLWLKTNSSSYRLNRSLFYKVIPSVTKHLLYDPIKLKFKVWPWSCVTTFFRLGTTFKMRSTVSSPYILYAVHLPPIKLTSPLVGLTSMTWLRLIAEVDDFFLSLWTHLASALMRYLKNSLTMFFQVGVKLSSTKLSEG